MSDPLQSLVVDAQDVDRGRLADLLQERARVDPKQGVIRFLPGVQERATIAQRIIIALLGRKALSLLDESHADGLTPAELSEATGVRGGSLRPSLKRLADDGVATKNGDSRYTIPVHAFERAVEMLENGRE